MPWAREVSDTEATLTLQPLGNLLCAPVKLGKLCSSSVTYSGLDFLCHCESLNCNAWRTVPTVCCLEKVRPYQEWRYPSVWCSHVTQVGSLSLCESFLNAVVVYFHNEKVESCLCLAAVAMLPEGTTKDLERPDCCGRATLFTRYELFTSQSLVAGSPLCPSEALLSSGHPSYLATNHCYVTLSILRIYQEITFI